MNEKLITCGICDENFNLDSQSGCLRLPLLLNCSHRICSQCLVQKQNSGWINCKQCSTPQNCHSLPKDFYIIGVMTRGDVENSEVAEEPPQLPVAKRSVCICSAQTTKSCSICKKLICDVCFATTHNSEFFADHHLVDSSSAAGLMTLFYDDKFCPLHNSDRTLYCKNCRKIVCLSCLKACSSHDLGSVESQNLRDVGSVLGMKSKITNALEGVKEGLKILPSLQKSWDSYGKEASDSIDLQISDLIALLEVTGNKHKQKVKKTVKKTKEILGNAGEDLQFDGAKLQDAVRKIDFLLENVPKTRLYREILEEINIKIGVVATGLKMPKNSTNPFKFEVSSSIKSKIKQIQLIADTSKTVPEITSVINNIPIKSKEKVQKPFELEDSWDGEGGSSLVLKARETKFVDDGWDPKPRHTIPKHPMVQSKRFFVQLLHFNSFFEFYVRPTDQLIFIQEQDKLEKDMQEFYRGQRHPKIIQNPKKGTFAAACVGGIWRRCVITAVDRSKFEIFLVDIGQSLKICEKDLKLLDQKFYSVKQAAVRCRLGHIKTKEEFDNRIPRALENEFKKLEEFKLEIFVLGVMDDDTGIPVVFEYFPGNGKKINFNAMLVHKFHVADSTGVHSSKEAMVNDEIEVGKVEENTPQHLFYNEIQLQADQKALENNIHKKPNWESGDFCFVEHQIDEVVEWHRGQVIEAFNDGFLVFLIDEEVEIECKAEKMLVMDGWMTEEPSMKLPKRKSSSGSNEHEADGKPFNLNEENDQDYQVFCNMMKERNSEPPRLVNSPPKVTTWQAPQPLTVKSFIGFPTNVDDNEIITIQDEAQRQAVTKLQEDLKERYLLECEDFTVEVKVGQIVVVHNIFDGKFYRGIVEERHENDFKIQFVDFGIVETVERSEIYTDIKSRGIPIQSRKFRVADENKEFTPKGLDSIRAKIIDVETKVEVFAVTDDDIIDCTIESLHSRKKVSEPKLKPQQEENANDDVVIEKIEIVQASKPKPLETFNEPPTRSFSSYKDISIQFYNIKQKGITKFNCTFAGIVDKIHVYPLIPSLTEQIDKLEEKLAVIDESSLSKFSDLNRSKNRLCLVKDFGVWKRGKINRVKNDEVDVLLVDSATSFSFPAKSIFKLPVYLSFYPQKTLPISLFRDLKTEEEKIELVMMMDKKKMHAVVKNFDQNYCPVVELLDENGNTIY